MSATWEHGLFGCMDNLGVSAITFLFPCYQFGKNARIVGESCLRYGFFCTIPFLNIFAAIKIRGRIREMKRIRGTILSDALAVTLCPFCALIQETQEMDTGPGSRVMSIMKIIPSHRHQSKDKMGSGPRSQSMDRTEMGGAGAGNVEAPEGVVVDASAGSQSTALKEIVESKANQSMDKLQKQMSASAANQSMDKLQKEMSATAANQSMDKLQKEMSASAANKSMDKLQKEMSTSAANKSMDKLQTEMSATAANQSMDKLQKQMSASAANKSIDNMGVSACPGDQSMDRK